MIEHGAEAGAGAGLDARPDAADGGQLVSLTRGIAVLRAFGAERPAMTLAEVARATALSRASASRVLRTLEQVGYVRADGRTFVLTPRVLELGWGYLSALGLPALAQPHLDALCRRVGESTSVSVLDGHDVVYVARSAARRVMTVSVTVGTRFPAHATSMGRVLLAALSAERRPRHLPDHLPALTARTTTDPARLASELSAVAARGWCLVDQELEDGLRSLAVPVRRAGQVVAAANVAVAVTDRGAGELVERLLEPLQAAAVALSADLDRTAG